MSEDNLTAVLHGIDDIRMEQTPKPVAGPGEVLIRMSAVGICGSDVHYWRHGRIGDFIVKAPMILGHEASGVVAQVGEGVTHLKPGDRVAIEPGVPCRICGYCKGEKGLYNLCEKMKFCATPPYDGNLMRYYKHAADFCYKLPDHVSLEEGALLEPLSVGVHACRRAKVTAGSKMLILGAGPIGLVNLLVAKAMGASKIVITDIDEHRLRVAESLGADHCILVKRGQEPQQLAQQVADKLGEMPDITIECSGAESSIQTAIYATRSGGCVMLVGMGSPTVSVPIINAFVREVDIRGVFRYANCYPLALELVSSKKVDVKPLITHRFELENSVAAFEIVKNQVDNPIKVIIRCDGGQF